MSSLPPRVTSISIATAFHDRRSAATRVRVACVGSGRMSGNGQGLGRTGKAPEERFAKHGLEVRPRVRAWKRSSVCQSEPTPRGLLFETKKENSSMCSHQSHASCFLFRVQVMGTSDFRRFYLRVDDEFSIAVFRFGNIAKFTAWPVPNVSSESLYSSGYGRWSARTPKVTVDVFVISPFWQ